MPKPKSASVPREVKHDAIGVEICIGERSLTSTYAKSLLGWVEEKEGDKFGADYLLNDENGVKVRCVNNSANRPFSESWCRQLCQDILMCNWRFNLETIIIGKTGQVLSGQHRLVALVLAVQKWSGNNKLHWADTWPNEPTLDTLIAFGAEEDHLTTRTLDNVKPRTLADVIITSGLFAKSKKTDRDKLARSTDFAVRLLWHRTGAKNDAFSPYRTHSESLNFIDRHPRLLRAVKHIHEENQENAIGRFLPTGTAAGILYLMGCSTSDGDKYRNADPPQEHILCWDMWDKACEFWACLGSGSPTMKTVRVALGSLENEDSLGGSKAEKLAVICKAWNVFAKEYDVQEEDVTLTYETDEYDIKHLVGCPTVGGIDLGNPRDNDSADIVDTVTSRKEEVDREKLDKLNHKSPPRPKVKKS